MKDVLTDYLWVFLVAMVISLLATPVSGRLARSLGIVDRPVGRKVHKNPTPYLGGLAMLVAWLAAAVLGGMFFLSGPSENTPLIGIIIGCTIATGIGLLDDVIDLKPVIKVGGQLAAACALIFCGVGLKIGDVLFGPLGLTLPPSVSPVVSAALTVLVVLAVCNSVNLLDGLDGLCSGVIVIMVGALTVLALTLARYDYNEVFDPTRMIVCMAILGAILGFIPYNFNPASIFMGDAGSMLLGFVAASLFLLLGENTPNIRWFYAALMVFGLPGMDTALAIFRRVRAGKSPASPDAHHLHHQLIRQGLTVRQAVAMLYVLAAFFALAGLMMVMLRVRYGFIVVAFVIGIMTLVTTSFQLHRMGPSDRISDETIRQLPKEAFSEELDEEAGDSERDEGEASAG
ncbi:MAG: undecaprenyl/decaprenyl-phosphate alpha-N-acetylglucosaminyl 1-phosphate transferase [Phycisphaerae bacterium]|nr:undecaprenyl/decaprenyl-phosphate alpha-N-acetylglucosaminyl 1-phosphate transferase [Phycisphaerae bacterium]